MPRDKADISRTFDKLVEGELARRNELATIDDPRRPKTKSPVRIQIAWIDSTPIEPHSTVRLVRALIDPDVDESAPNKGLKFLAMPFAEGDVLLDYAITLGPATAGVTKSGSLTTRTDDDTGTLTMAGGHGITTGQSLILLWEGGSRTVNAGTVAGNSVPIDGGVGTILPDAATAVSAVLSAGITEAVMPECYWARVDVSDEAHMWAGIPSGGSTLESVSAGGLRIIWKPAGTGEKLAIVSMIGGEDRKVATDPTDEHPRELIGKLANTGTYDPDDHQLVYGQVLFDPGDNPDNLLRLYTAKGEGSEGEKFRVFELAERKYSTESAATVRWLDHDLKPNLTVDPENVFDPMLLFSGAAAGYAPWASEFTRGMRGIAELWNDRPRSIAGTLTTRTDNDTGTLTLSSGHGVMTGNTVDVFWNDHANSRLGMTVGTVSGTSVPIDGGTGDNLPAAATAVQVVNQDAVLGDPIWKIVAMEGFARFIKARIYGVSNYPSPGTTFEARYSSILEKPTGSEAANWERCPPCTVDGAVGYEEDLTMYRPVHDAPNVALSEVAGDWVYMQIADRDTDPPTYRVYQVNHPGRRVQGTVVNPGSGYVSKAATTFQLTNLVEVYGGPPPEAPLTVQQVFDQGYVAGQVTEAVFHEDSGDWEDLPLARKVLASLNEDGNGFMYPVASQLAGAGLAVEAGTGPPKTDGTGNTDKLKIAAPPTSEGSGVVICHKITGVEVTIDTAGVIKVKINATPVYVYGTAATGTSFEDTVDVWDKKSITYATEVACDDGSIVYTTDTDDVLTPPTG